jgi:hypothetical protein
MSDIALRYLGGAYIHGVPARDLTADEAAQHGALIADQEAVTGTKMYEPVQPAAAPAKATKQAAQPAQEE